MDELRLGAVEARFADIIWENEPLSSGELVKKCAETLEWVAPDEKKTIFPAFFRTWRFMQPVYQYLSQKYPENRLIDMYYDFVAANKETLSEKYALDIVASGGVSAIDDIKALRKMELYGAIIGKAYYTGAIDLSEAIKVSK